MMAKLRIGGVPEHFNYLWHVAREEGLFAQAELDIQWQDFPGGTGAMRQALTDNALDMAVLLTEGAVAGVAEGAPFRIAGTYVKSPLSWGIHAHHNSSLQGPPELSQVRIAISRYGSGSHLMAAVHAWKAGHAPDRLHFVPVGSLEGARDALAAGQADIFLWEKFTTKPLVDQGEWKRIGEVQTPWPAFVMAVRQDVAEQNGPAMRRLMRVLREAMHQMDEPQTIDYIARGYHQRREDVAEWFRQTQWLVRPRIDRGALDQAQEALVSLGMITERRPLERYHMPGCALTEPQLSEQMYNWRVSSVHQHLSEMGKSCGGLTLKDLLALGHLDQYHYLGKHTSFELVQTLGLSSDQHVLDIGSGVGGTSRVLAHQSGCQVTALEVQPELNELAEELTYRLGLSEHITYITGDFMTVDLPAGFDHFISLLVFLHLEDRPAALRKSARLLKAGGSFVIEDLILRTERPSSDKWRQLHQTLSAPALTDVATYRRELEGAGFVGLESSDLTQDWTQWTDERYQAFVKDEHSHKRLFGQQVYQQRAHFYRTVRDLFAEGVLGGVRFLGRNPKSQHQA